jgi:hypothetical protein
MPKACLTTALIHEMPTPVKMQDYFDTKQTGLPLEVRPSDGLYQELLSAKRHDDCDFVFPSPKTLKPFVSDTARKLAVMPDLRMTQVKTTQRYAHLSNKTLLDVANAAVGALGGAFMPQAIAVSYQVLMKPYSGLKLVK